MTQLQLMQALRLKGRVTAEDLAATLNTSKPEVEQLLHNLTESGEVVAGKTLRLSPAGQARLAELLSDERSSIDATAASATYREFRNVNADFKALVTDWQLKDGTPNLHDDPEYDGRILSRLDGVHARVTPVIAEACVQIPRLDSYAQKLTNALNLVQAGESHWLTRPIIDSYHTVWFELHEELIGMAGLTRQDEAQAGHAG